MPRIGANISVNEQVLLNQLGDQTLREVRAVVYAEVAAKNQANQRSNFGALPRTSPVITSWNVLQRQQAKFVKIIKLMAGIDE